MEVIFLPILAGIIIYLKLRARYADLRTKAEKESLLVQPGIDLFNQRTIPEALAYFTEAIREQRGVSVAYLYRARCHRALGNTQAALADLEAAKGYDDTQAEIHLEIGQIHFQAQDYKNAFVDFDKAVFHSYGKKAEPYQWRGMTRERLGQYQEGRQDIQQAIVIRLAQKQTEQPVVGPLLNRRLLLFGGFTSLCSAVLLVLIKISPVVHWPYLFAAISAVLIGLAEPRKGWALALLQVFTLWVGYTFFTTAPTTTGELELEQFNVYGSIGLTLIGSYIASVLIKEYRRVTDV